MAIILFNSIVFIFLMDKPGDKTTLAYVILFVSWIYALYVLRYQPYRKYHILLTSYFTTTTDILLITAWIYATGGYQSNFYLLLYLSILSIALRFSFKATVYASVLYILVYISVFFSNIQTHFAEMLIRIVYLEFTAIAGGFLSSQAMDRIRDKIIIENSEKEARVSEMKLRRILSRLREQIRERRNAERELQKAHSGLEIKVRERTKDLYTSNELLRQEILERKRVEEQLHFKIRELDTFIYRATHDIRGPLSSMLGLISLTRAVPGTECVEQHLGMMEKSVKRLDSILLDLLNVSLIKHGKLKYSYIDLEAVTYEIIHSIRDISDDMHIHFSVSVEVEGEFYADRTLIITILQNLIENGIKYRNMNNSESIIHVEIRQLSRSSVEIQVRDNGIGIPENLQAKVFDMFFRGSLQGSGTGLGLYIVKNAVEKMEGSIHMESTVNQGSTFTILLPSKNHVEEIH